MIKILFIGDICGKPGREAVKQVLPALREKHDIDIVITNIENSAHGRGAHPAGVRELMYAGVDVMTAGNHIWKGRFEDVLSGEFPIARPMNYPVDLPGVGFIEYDLGQKGKVLVASIMGVAFFFNERTLEEPLRRLERFLSEEVNPEEYSAIFVDFHAEATAEKLSAGLYFDGRVTALVGTHTHIPTADERILPGGTAYMTDVGMVGTLDSVLWVKKELVFAQNMYPYPVRYDIEEDGPVRFDSVLIEVGEDRKAVGIRRINKIL